MTKQRGSIAARAALGLAALLCAGCLAGCGAARPAAEDNSAAAELNVRFFNAGAADAALLSTANSAVLIDAGEKGFGREILACLREQGIEKLDCLIVTHFDRDHVGGCARVLNNIPVERVLQNGCPKDSEEYDKYIRALENAGIEPQTVRDTLRFTLDGVRYCVMPAQRSDYESDESNNASLIVTVENGAHTLLFLGDAQTERLREYLDAGAADCDVLKVAHHGRDEPLLAELLAAVTPEWAVVTSSDEEPESAETMALLENASARVLLTREGTFDLRSDGKEIVLSRN